MHIGDEPVIAFCYLRKTNDLKNACFLSKKHLFVKEKGILSPFPLESVQDTSFGHRLILLPLVIGGILTPLSLHALFHHYFNIWLLFSLAFIGVILIYYGIQGTNVFTVHTAIKNYDFFIPSSTVHLKSFSSYVRVYQRNKEALDFYYFIYPKQLWQQAQKIGEFIPDKPIRLYFNYQMKQVNMRHDEVVLSFPSGRAQVSFRNAANNEELIPVIHHKIPLEYIKEV
ncbi:hypothetical protein LVD15_13490 [Fulvivirga maritima]|uniref:hypothetical protein n=1 Tax=Fulvivirga maritima TaxID=2904247 RepID=UPI001F1B0932|nr:hypothetical protein [Fulvivirga maritima]UII29398.1 hypothetical protein LVD15_13490 [Fulvivirga maritima]